MSTISTSSADFLLAFFFSHAVYTLLCCAAHVFTRIFCHLCEAVCQKVIMILEIIPILTLSLPKMSGWFVEVSLGSHLNKCGLTWGSSSFTKEIIRCDNSAVLPLLFHDQGVFFLLLYVSLPQSHQVVLMWATQAALMTDWGGGTFPPSRQHDQERQMRKTTRRKWSSSWPRRRRKSRGCPWTNALWVLWSCFS